jgi:hypothetical protein
VQLLVLAMQILRKAFDLAERAHLGSLYVAHEQHVHHDANERHNDLLQSLGRKVHEAVVHGKEEKGVKQHDKRRDDASAKAEERRAKDKPCDQYHVWVRYVARVYQRDEHEHDRNCYDYLLGKAGLSLQEGQSVTVGMVFLRRLLYQVLSHGYALLLSK